MCFNEIPSHFSVLWISVVQFSKTDAPYRLSCQRLSYYTPSNRFCQAFFQTFLKKFFEARFSLFFGVFHAQLVSFAWGFHSIPNIYPLVKGFCKVFLRFIYLVLRDASFIIYRFWFFIPFSVFFIPFYYILYTTMPNAVFCKKMLQYRDIYAKMIS